MALLTPVGGPTLPGLPAADRPLVVGVLNVTPDSFSDGGRFLDHRAAVAHGHRLAADGADLVDVGGESTRPGAGRVPAAEECRRVLPVVRDLTADGVPVSIDTTRAAVARAAVEAGAVLVNDVSGARQDPGMAGLLAGLRVACVLMHWRAPSAVMASFARYDDPAGDVVREVAERVDAVVAAGVDPAAIAVDPGIGFAKEAAHNWAVLAGVDRLAALGRPVMVGVSRKRFLGALLAGPDGQPRQPQDRDAASAAVAALVAARGVWAVRAHDARATRDAVEVGARWAREAT
ncbi:MAG: dihydropteroate synthase [Actinomycetales bacterium]